MGLWLNAAFVRAPADEVQAGLEHVLTLRGRKAAPWSPPADLQHARAATSPWWSLGGFAGGADWTCVLTAPFDILTHDGAAVMRELSRACGTEVWQLDVEDGDAVRVFRAADGEVSRAGFLTRELDEGLAFDPMLLVPILSDVDVAGACNTLRARAPKAAITVVAAGQATKRHPADLVRDLARTDCSDVAAVVAAIAAVFGGEHARLVDNATTLSYLIAGRPLPVTPAFALWTHVETPEMIDPVADSLLEWRAQFPALESCVHLISHSLGCVPAKAADDLREFTEIWATRSITAWSEWLPEVDRAAARIEKIISAPRGTVVMNQNVSTIMAVIASCLEYTPARNKIVYESLMFPTVSYVWQAEQRRGAECVLVPSKDGITIDVDAMCDAIDERTLVVPMSHVIFSSAYIQDARKICAKAKAVGAHVILDCYQSVGIIPLDVVDLGVAFACGGSVKYLCGGPGAAWLYIRPDVIPQFAPRVTGWFGNEAPFAFTMPAQSYADNAWRYMGGTPAIAALYQSRAGQAIIGEIGATRIRAKSLVMTAQIIEWVDELGFKLNSPRPEAQRGGSVVFDFPGAADVCRELNRRKFFCDHRPGVGIRIAPHFYTKAEELGLFFAELKKIRG